MKWFKHMTNFRFDPFTMRIRRRLNRGGKLSWYLLVEVMAENCNGDSCSVKMHKADWLFHLDLAHNAGATLHKLLSDAQDAGRLSFELKEDLIEVTMPEIIQIRDEHSRKVRSKSGQTPERSENIHIRSDQTKTSTELANRIIEAIAKFGLQGYDAAVKYCRPESVAIIKAYGGWAKLCKSDASKVHFLRLDLQKLCELDSQGARS